MTLRMFFFRYDGLIWFTGVVVMVIVLIATAVWLAFAPSRIGGEEPATLVRKEWHGGIIPLQDFPTGAACDKAAESRGWQYFCVPAISEKYANWNAGRVIIMNRRIMP